MTDNLWSYVMLTLKQVVQYCASDTMEHFSKTKLNLRKFYKNPTFFIGSLEKSLQADPEQLEVMKKLLFGEVMWERNIWPLWTQYIYTCKYGPMYVHMTSSKVVRTRHHIRRFFVDPWYWKYTQTHSTRQAPWMRGRKNIWFSLKGTHSNCGY